MLEPITDLPDVRHWSSAHEVEPATRGLSDAERGEAEQVARRLHAELQGTVALLPDADRGASAMGRALQLDRATCQRIIGTVSRAESDAESLVQLPGVQGLRQFVAAMGKRPESNVEQLAACSAAIDRFESLLRELGGSQRRLRERLQTGMLARRNGHDTPTYVGADDPGARRTLFGAAAAITGRWCDISMTMRIIRPTAADPRLTEEVVVRGLLGHVARAEAVPLVVGLDNHVDTSDGTKSAFSALDAKPLGGAAQRSLLAPFCSSPLPKVISRSAGTKVVQLVDLADRADDGPVDIVIANRSAKPEAHPATLRPAIGELWSLMTFPSRRILFDVYLHRDIARRCIPALEVHLWNPDIGQQGSSRWSTRFPGGPRLTLLGEGIAASAAEAYPRHAELTSHVFDQVDWDPAVFVGFRCEVPFPIWRGGYCMVFDFAGNEM